MNMKSVLLVSLIVLAVFCSLSIASATDAEILGEKFSIPDGYSEVASKSGSLDFSSYGAQAAQGSSLMVSDASNKHSHSFSVVSGSVIKDKAEYKTFAKDKDKIAIYVYKLGGDGKIDIKPNSGDTEKTIDGKTGFYNAKDKSFIYKDDSNKCIVKIFAKEDKLKDII